MKHERIKPRGPFILRLPAGRPLKFKDAAHFGNACGKLSQGRFSSMLDFCHYARSLPNGYNGFLERNGD